MPSAAIRRIAHAGAAHPLLVCAGSAALLAAVASRTPQGLHFYDPVIQLLALKQHLAGLSPSWRVFMRVSPADLARSVPEAVAWWPPGTPLCVLPLARLGLRFGPALRVVALGAVLLGSLGWVGWFRKFELPPAWIAAWAALVPWIHLASENLFRYSADGLAFAAAPWILLLAARWHRASEQPRLAWSWAIGTGIAAAAAYWLKYSLFVTAVAAIGSVLIGQVRSGWRKAPLARARPALACLLLVAAGPLSLGAFLTHGGPTPLAHAIRGPQVIDLAFFAANPALAAADAVAPLFFAVVYPGWPPLATYSLDTLAWIGLPFGLLLGWLLARSLLRRPAASHAWVGALTLLATAVCLLGLWLVADAGHESRLVAPAAVGALPVALEEARRLWAVSNRMARVLWAAVAAAMVAVPLAFGPFYVAAKVRQGASVRTGASGLALPSFHTDDLPALLERLGRIWTPDSVWVVENPEEALELPGRSLLLFAGASIGEEVRNLNFGVATAASWRSSRPVRLLALLPRSFGADAPPPVLAGVSRVRSWTKKALPAGSGLILWEGDFRPDLPGSPRAK